MKRTPVVAGFVKIRNEILREGNLYRLLDQLAVLCQGGVICDDASTDGTYEAVVEWNRTQCPRWNVIRTPRADFSKELQVKQWMLDIIHCWKRKPDWILWMDGDEIFDRDGLVNFSHWLAEQDDGTDIWSFHYTQLWRSASWARIDHGFDYGYFWKLWRYKPTLAFEIKDGLHHAQFPSEYIGPAVNAAERQGSYERAKRSPFEILHLGNYGKNLAWKAIQYRNSGVLASASLERHLYFTDTAVRSIDPLSYPAGLGLTFDKEKPVPFSQDDLKHFERIGDLKKREGLCVVIVPTYNRGYALDTTLGSVRDQTHDNWICVVLDDGSTDNTPELMKGWQQDPRFFYARYEENRGGVAMNEIGMNVAIEFGEYWMRLGSDDFFRPHKLALDVLAFENGADAVYGPYCDLHGNAANGRLGDELRNPPHDARGALLSRGFAASWANIAVRCKALEAVRDRHGNFCEPDIRNMEDWLVNSRISYLYEWTWRGIVARPGEQAEVIIGARDLKDLGKLEPNQPEVRRDAVWRIGADGASQMGKQCALDAAASNTALNADAEKFKPEPRVMDYNVIRLPWHDR